MTPSVQSLSEMIRAARRVVAFTGAGISTESGVPDFRSPGGVWSRMKPITFQAFVGDEDKRREAWARAFSGAAGWTGASPNAGHYAVARLAQAGKVSAVITQNVDNLHQDSGVAPDQVIELHGNASYATCLDCKTRYELDEFRRPFLEAGVIPVCRWCGGLVKTATIAFGQAMPEPQMARARAETLACDLFLVLGSSLAVYPAAGFPRLARESGVPLAIVNRDPTPQDRLASLVLHDEIGPVMPAVAAAVQPQA